MSQRDTEQKRHTRDKGRSLVEWVTLAISILIVLVVAGLIVYQATVADDRQAVIKVEPRFGELREEEGRYYLPVAIGNTGDKTAAGVVVQLSLETVGRQSETASLTVDFLAGGAAAEGVAIFRQKPSADNLSYMASYMEP